MPPSKSSHKKDRKQKTPKPVLKTADPKKKDP